GGGMGIMVTLIPHFCIKPPLQSQAGGQSVMSYLHFGHAQHVSSADLSAWSTRASFPTSLKGVYFFSGPASAVEKMDSHCTSSGHTQGKRDIGETPNRRTTNLSNNNKGTRQMSYGTPLEYMHLGRCNRVYRMFSRIVLGQ
ncbi:hypothetical protein Tco_0093606, partial [Tanacetum coccineum]